MDSVPDLSTCRVEELLAAVVPTNGFTTELAIDLVASCGDIAGLSRLPLTELRSRLPAKMTKSATALAAAFELGRRVVLEQSSVPRAIRCGADVAAWAIPRIGGLPHEELWLLAVDGRNRLRGVRRIAMGGLHGVGIRAADPLRHALRADASSFVLVHNHPSGDPTPSREDIAFTKAIADAAAVVGVPLLDHVVVSRDAFTTVPFPPEGAPE